MGPFVALCGSVYNVWLFSSLLFSALFVRVISGHGKVEMRMVWRYLCARMGEDDDSGTVVARVGIWGLVDLGI